MTDRDMLLAAIREQPDEDTPRLAYADVLEEQGHDLRNQYFLDWAALIRTQIEFARVERFSSRWFGLARAQAALFEKRKQDWTTVWGSRLGRAAYRRGFLEAHQFYPVTEGFLASFGRFVDRNPLRCIRFIGLEEVEKPTLSAIARHEGLGRVETLDLTNCRTSLVRKFLTVVAPRMPRLRALGLGDLRLTAASAGGLLASLAIPNLTSLDLSENLLFGSVSLAEYRPESLLHSRSLANVRWLDLFRTSLTPAAVHALAHSPVLKNLRYLNLGTEPFAGDDATFGADGAEALATGPAVRGVEFLSLFGQRIGPHGFEAVLRSPLLSTVRELDLQANELGDEGAIALAASPHVAALRKLTLEGNGIGLAGVEAILTSPHLAGLRILILGQSAPAPSPVWQQLRERFPDKEPTMPGIHGSDFFEPIP